MSVDIEFDDSKVLCTYLSLYKSVRLDTHSQIRTGTHRIEEQESSTKRRLMDARRIAKNLEDVRSRESRMMRDVVVKISTRLNNELNRFERDCVGSLLSFSKRLEASEHLVASFVLCRYFPMIDLPRRFEMNV